MTAQRFITAARGLKGARWRHRGRKAWAVDCIGLVVLSARRAGLPMDDADGYGREPWEDRLRKECAGRFGAPLKPDKAAPGDVALIRWNRGEPSHVGIVGDHPDGGLTLIHAHNLRGVIEQGMTGPVLAAVLEVYRPNWGPHVP